MGRVNRALQLSHSASVLPIQFAGHRGAIDQMWSVSATLGSDSQCWPQPNSMFR